MHESRINSRRCLPSSPEDKHQHGKVANRRNHHHDAVCDNGHFMAIVKLHINRQFRVVAIRHFALLGSCLHLEETTLLAQYANQETCNTEIKMNNDRHRAAFAVTRCKLKLKCKSVMSCHRNGLLSMSVHGVYCSLK